MNTPTDRQIWLESRRFGIGGSDIASIVGLSKWSTAYDVWLDKRGETELESEETEYQYWGTRLEAIVADEYKIRSGRQVQRVNSVLIHPEADFARAHIDRAVVNPEISGTVRWKDGRLTTDRILECKTSNAFTARLWGEAETDEVPDYYLVQVQWYLGITGCEVGDLAVLIGGNQYRSFTIRRDDEIIADLLEEGRKFWQLVQTGVAPDPQTLEDAKRIWAQHVPGRKLIVDVDTASAIGELAQLAEMRKQIEAKEEALKLRLFTEMKDAEDVVFEHGGEKLASWKTQITNRLDQKALRDAHPDIANQFTTPSSSRVLRLTKAAKELANG